MKLNPSFVRCGAKGQRDGLVIDRDTVPLLGDGECEGLVGKQPHVGQMKGSI